MLAQDLRDHMEKAFHDIERCGKSKLGEQYNVDHHKPLQWQYLYQIRWL